MKRSQEMKIELKQLKVKAAEVSNKTDVTIEELTASTDAIKLMVAKISHQEQIEEAEFENRIASRMPQIIPSDDTDPRASALYSEAFYNLAAGRPLTPEQTDVLGAKNIISSSGVPVPKSFQNKLIVKLQALNIMRNLGDVISTNLDTDIPMMATIPSADWTAENGAFVDGDDTFGTITLKAYKLTRICKVSEEILADNTFNLEDYLVKSFAIAIGMPEESAFIRGSGANQPQGVTVGASVGKVCVSAIAITADELIDLFYSLKRQYRKNATWIMNDNTLKAIRKLKDGQGNYLWAPGLTGEPESILGKPVETSEFVDDIATTKLPVVFGDIKYYTIADRGARTFQRLNELYSANGQIGFRGYERVDGRVMLSEAIKSLRMA